jgi:acyl-CoA ligase (AMP-forming) (exosortase A-associated)
MERALSLYTLGDLLERWGSSSAPALVQGPRRVSYAELAALSRRLAALLEGAGLRRGERVCIYLPRSVEAAVAFFAAQLAGAAAVLINDKLRAQQVHHILSHSEASVLVTESRLLRAAPGIELGGARLILLDEAQLGEGQAEKRERAPAVGRDLAMIIYTSGSTGLPKGILLSHENLLSGAQIVADYLQLSPEDRIISLLPFTFDYGLNQLLSSILTGATLVIQRSMFPADICKTLEREAITGMAGVPMLWSQLAQPYSPFTRSSFPALRYMTNSGGRFPEPLVKLFREAHPHVRLYLMYGLTEAFRSTYLDPDQVELRPGSIGKAIPNVEILVVNENGEACAPGEAGELVHRGANIALGYWRDPEATRRVFRPHPFQKDRPGYEETVVYSGDIVKRDEEGYLYFVGRKDQMIKSQGFRVSPEEIEHYIRSSRLVAEVAAFAVGTDGVEPEIIAAIIPADPVSFEEEALREFSKREMPEYMRPACFWRLDVFPQTTSGKPDRRALTEAYLARHR